MQKEHIFEKMNGFLEEDTFSIPKKLPSKMNLPMGKSVLSCMRERILQNRISAGD